MNYFFFYINYPFVLSSTSLNRDKKRYARNNKKAIIMNDMKLLIKSPYIKCCLLPHSFVTVNCIDVRLPDGRNIPTEGLIISVTSDVTTPLDA